MRLFSKPLLGCKMLLTCTSLMISLSMVLCSCSANKEIKKSTAAVDSQHYSEFTETEDFPVKLEPMGDESFIIKEKPRRLAVLSADLVQALDDIGAASTISNICCDAPDSVNAPGAKMSGTVLDPDIDTILASKPSWVLVSTPMRQKHLDILNHHGIQVITFPSPVNTEEICNRYRMLFTLCFGSKGNFAFQEFVQCYQEKYDSIVTPAAEYSDITGKKSGIYLAVPDYTMATGETFEGQLMETISVENMGSLGSQWLYPEEEQRKLNPEIIFYDKTIPEEKIIESDIYKNSIAVEENQLFPIDFSAVRLKGLPMLEELEKMATAAYPEAFPQ